MFKMGRRYKYDADNWDDDANFDTWQPLGKKQVASDEKQEKERNGNIRKQRRAKAEARGDFEDEDES